MRALAFALILFCPRTAEAGECPAKEGPWVKIDPSALDPALQTNVMLQLRSAFARRKITACESGEHPLATIVLAPSEGEGVRIGLSVRDEVTNKLVERTVRLADVPADARALALAEMTDELLRASWAELTVEDAPPPPIPVPPQVKDALPKPQRRIRFQTDVAFALDHFSQGHDELGVDVAVRLWPTSRVGATLRGGPRGALSRTVVPGSISGGGFFAGIGPSVALLELPRFGLDLEGTAAILYTSLSGQTSADGLAVLFLATASAWVRLAPLRVFVDLGGGGAARGVRVTDGAHDLGGPAGFLLTMRAGVGAEL